jgi:ComF family protein
MDAVGCALLPASCTLCGSPLPHLSSAPICDACLNEFSVQGDPRCTRCGDRFHVLPNNAQSVSLCRACRLAPPPFFRAVAFGPYEGRMRDAIHALKYNRMHSAARLLGRMLATAIARLATDAPADMLVVPVPLHRSKHAARGFNQARALAVHAVDTLRRTHPDWHLTLDPRALARIRATGSQAGLTPRQRCQNLRGAFKVSDPSAVAGRHILVIDDIFTTGATARAAAQALARAGAASVRVATLARAEHLNTNSRSTLADPRYSPLRSGIPGGTQTGDRGMLSSRNQPSF